MRAILEKFEQLIKPIEEIKGELHPPATDAEIDAVENDLGIQFPEDVRTFYKWHNGQAGIYSLFSEFRMLSLEEMMNIYRSGIKSSEPDYYEVEDDTGVFKDCIDNVKWIPIGDNGGNTILFLDMDPGAQGTVGQLLESCDGEPECNYNGIQAFMNDVIRKIEAGKIKWNETAGSFWPASEM